MTKCQTVEKNLLIPAEGIEPSTTRLRAVRSTTELYRLSGAPRLQTYSVHQSNYYPSDCSRSLPSPALTYSVHRAISSSPPPYGTHTQHYPSLINPSAASPPLLPYFAFILDVLNAAHYSILDSGDAMSCSRMTACLFASYSADNNPDYHHQSSRASPAHVVCSRCPSPAAIHYFPEKPFNFLEKYTKYLTFLFFFWD